MPDSSLIDGLTLLKRGHTQYCKSILLQYDLRASDMDVLAYLSHHPEGHTARQICEAMLIPKSLVSASVELLVSRGLIARQTDSADRRRVRLQLLPAAHEIIACLQARTKEYAAILCQGVDPEDLSAVERVFRQIRHNMNKPDANRKEFS